MNDVDPQAWLADVLPGFQITPSTESPTCFPWRRKASQSKAAAA